MAALRYLTSGESHGRALTGILEGVPAGLPVETGDIDRDLKRRQGGHGRGGRMKIESDRAEIISGVRWGKTLGSPVTLLIENKDFPNWSEGMSVHPSASASIPAVTRARPGHADLAGVIKYGHDDIRNILERSSARETAMKVALGAVAKKLLSEFDIMLGSYVVQIGTSSISLTGHEKTEEELLELFRRAEGSSVRCPDEAASREMMEVIDEATQRGDSLGGVFEVFAVHLPPGLGSHVQSDRRIEGRLAGAVMAIQAIKGVEIGLGFGSAGKAGSEVMDEIFYDGGEGSGKKPGGFFRKTNNAGGIEGGMTNGMPLLLRACMKPIPTQRSPLKSVDIKTKKPAEAAYERSDVCAVPAAGVIAEAVVALTLADSFLEKFGGDSIAEVRRNYEAYLEHVEEF
jgi:chorismate synthase